MSLYNKLRVDQQLCDAVIRVDGVEFHAHKIILCNCSPYFINLFTQWSTQDCRVFDIPNVSPDMMKLIIEFAYTGSVPVTQENVKELFKAADQFIVEGIIQACCDLLEKQLTPQNCIGMWWFTDFYYTPEMKHKAFLFLLNRFEEVAATSEEFLQLSVQELVKIIEDDRLNVKQEKTVLSAILRWITYATEERREYTPLLLSKVRLALMSPEYITDSVSNNELVKASEDCRPILLMTLETMLHLRTNRVRTSIICNPLARPRLPPAILLAFGGWSNGGPTNCIEAYDVRADCWANVTDNEEDPRTYHGTVFLDGSVYAVGGFDNVERLSSVHRFDLGTQTWQKVSPMHSRRCFVSVTVMDGSIYAIGGYDGHERLQTAERYQPKSNQWTFIAPMHEQRSDAKCTALRGRVGGAKEHWLLGGPLLMVYICGGFNGNECLSTAECYNPETNQWTLIANMGERRSGAGVIAYADRVYVVGGFSGNTRLRTAEAYNANTDTWHTVPSMMSSTRTNFGIEVIDDSLFVVGGYNGLTTIPNVERYDVNTGEWSDICDMGISRSGLGCCVVYGIPNLAEYAAPHHNLQFSVEDDEVE